MALPQRAARPKPPAATQPPPAVESALSQALAMVAVALAQQPPTSAPPAAAPGSYAFNGKVEYYLASSGPFTANITGDALVTLSGPAATPAPSPSPT